VLTALGSSTSALQALQRSLDTSAANLANVDTNAFKGRSASFQDLPYFGPVGNQIGEGVRVGAITSNLAQGKTPDTGKELDISVQGQGYFSLLSANGTTQYTRDGSFHLNATGQLVSSDGLIVQPPITFPANVLSTKIAVDGTVSVLTAASPNTPVVLGQLHLTTFENQQGLNAIGTNRYLASDSSGLPLTNLPGTNGLGFISQGTLEQSNVDATTEMVRLVNTSRDYTVNSRALKVEDEIVKGGLSLVT
jgi:flagellar basal-body rod protein FlgG